MKGSKDKCILIVSRNEHVFIKTDDVETKSSYCKKLLGIKID